MTSPMLIAIVLCFFFETAVHLNAGDLMQPGLAEVSPGSDPSDSGTSGNQNDSSKRETKAITGRLVDESGQPIPNAAVFLRKAGAAAGPSRSIGTDENGRFRADDLVSGSYSVSAFVPGYVPAAEKVETEFYRPGDVVNLSMMKGGVITGTVTNSSGEPVVGVTVSTTRLRDGENRPIRGASQSNSRPTDDRGVYRLYGLLPGSYLVLASGGQASFQSTGFESDVPTYYPSTTRDAAGEVVVRAGQEISGIDIRYRGDKGHIVSGTLTGALVESGSAPQIVAPMFLAHRSTGAIESRAFVQFRLGRGFAFYGVPDGEYDVVVQMNMTTENSMASTPRQVVVKGSDVTGLEIALVTLGSISGRVVLERFPSERPADCKAKRIASLDELVLMTSRDAKAQSKDQPMFGFDATNTASPDEKGEFKIHGVSAGRYRIELTLPSDDWFMRALNRTTAASKQSDVVGAGIAITQGQRVTDLMVMLSEGAASMRGKVVAATEGARLPGPIQVHLVPAEPESADDVIRYVETRADQEGAFSLSNLAPGRYYIHTRAVSEEQLVERRPQPISWEAAPRVKLRRDAQAANVIIELKQCQQVTEYVLKYGGSPAKKAEPKKTD